MDIFECRLVFHKKIKSDEDILFSCKDFPLIKPGCLLEIFHLENEKHHLIKIESVNQTYQQKDTISFDQHLAGSLKLTPNKVLKFRIIDENLITLDVLDIIIKEQYLSRSDIHRFTNSIRNSVLQMNKKLEFGPYRGTIGEMWCRGQRNHTGYFGSGGSSGGSGSRAVFRSATAVVHIFIQMSAEMWQFDYFGELYFDKAINFVSDLFNKWNDNVCGHDVTIVLFSRLFYTNLSHVKISENVRNNIKIDQNGRYYEDFYIVVVQNERYVIGEWRKVIKTLKFRFNNYKAELEEFQQKNFVSGDIDIESYLSSAEDANFLETLNMTLNLYESYYIDRNFERTGKICVVITAGSGVYNVDRVQTHITKQRICDLGVGMDLVCIGEQPLHSVPLFIFHQKNSKSMTDNHYYIPYWINHSFYRSVNELQAIQMGKFIPRIKLAFEKNTNPEKLFKNKMDCVSDSDMAPSSFPFAREVPRPEVISENIATPVSTSNNCERSGLFTVNYGSHSSKDDSYIHSVKSGSKKSTTLDNRKALFNPFAPNRFNVRTTSNSRRWSHVFPIDKNNKPIQLHHQLAINTPNCYGFEKKKSKNMVEAWKNYLGLYNSTNNKQNDTAELSSSPLGREPIINSKNLHEIEESDINVEKSDFPILSDKVSDDSVALSPLPGSFQGGCSQKSFPPGSSNKGSINRRVHTLFTEGEQKWSWEQPKEDESPTNHMDVEEAIKLIGVDWKSLTLPAMLPITSDYYPSSKTLEDDFLESNYQLMANSLDSDSNNHVPHRKPLGIQEVFQELIYQRLNQGFQLITIPPSLTCSNNSQKDSNKNLKTDSNDNVVYRFSLGRIFHSIQMQQDIIHVTQYSPRHSNNSEIIAYNYCLKMPDSKDFMMSKTKFSTQMLEKFNWNYHDHYILNYGGNSNENSEDGSSYKLIPSLKFWRSRFFLLPTHSATRTIADTDKNTKIRCDIYDDKSLVEQNSLIEDFFKYLEFINKIKRRAPNSKQKKSVPFVDNSSNLMSSSNMVKVKSVSSNLLDLKKSAIQSACIVGSMNPMSPVRPTGHRHSTTNESNYFNQFSELVNNNNNSNPVTPIEKFPRQFTFDSLEQTPKSSSGYEIDKLCDASPISKVIEEMFNPQTGLTFLPSNEFPNEYTFTSYEAVNWCIRKMDRINDVKSAVIYLQKLMNLKYIFHASECPSHKFIYGFVFYCINSSNKLLNNGWMDNRNISNTNSSSSSSLTNLTTEETDTTVRSKRSIEWVEVYLSSIEIDGILERDWISEYLEKSHTGFHLNGESNRPIDSAQNFIFFMKKIPERHLANCLTRKNVQDLIGNSHDHEMLFEKNGVFYKKVVLDIENERNDRPEWGVFQYQANYHPTMAFELMFQWLVATGGKLSEKIGQWSRKLSFLQLVPVPCDPFALPSSINSDPLRGPIFVPLNINCLIDKFDGLVSSNHSIGEVINLLFEEFPDTERFYRLLLLQEVILKRFGFIRESCVNYSSKEHLLKYHTENAQKTHDGKSSSTNIKNSFKNLDGVSLNWSYIHYSGGMFAMIPSYSKYKDVTDDISTPIKPQDAQMHFTMSNVSRNKSNEDGEAWEATTVGFLWSWNKMLTRKWTATAMIIDEQFQDRMLADFREFCNNNDDRLRQFYFDLKSTANKYFCDISPSN